MPHYVNSEPAEMVLVDLAAALDEIDVGIVLLSPDLRVRYANRRFVELWAGPADLAARATSFRGVLQHIAASALFSVPDDGLAAYLDQREAAVRAGAISTVEIDLRDGRRLLFRSCPCGDDGRMLTYTDITPLKHERELLNAVREAAERTIVEQRFNSETLEQQGAYLASLAETADENARRATEANCRLKHEIAERRLLEAELRRLATTDALTGTLNRAQFLSLGQHAFERARRLGQEIVLLMLDIDYFKRINDSYGHFIGDEVLKHFVVQLRAGMRGSDLLGRLGGEEFAIVLPETDSRTGLQVAERLRARVAASPLVHNDRTVGITVSIGLAVARGDDATVEQVLARADAMLYAAKANGRNQVSAPANSVATASV